LPFVEPYFFIGYLVSIALFGLYQAVFMANAGGAWDNAKKIVETGAEDEEHAAALRRRWSAITVGDPFKDTSSVALNPVIKFTTLFGLLAGRARRQPAEDFGRLGGPRAGRALLRDLCVFRVPGRSTGCGLVQTRTEWGSRFSRIYG
jgi:hypothetical protein